MINDCDGSIHLTIIKLIREPFHAKYCDDRALKTFQMECNQVETDSGGVTTFYCNESEIVFEVKALKDFPGDANSRFDALLESKWQEAMNKGLFRFTYDSRIPNKRLPGKFGFFLEVRQNWLVCGMCVAILCNRRV